MPCKKLLYCVMKNDKKNVSVFCTGGIFKIFSIYVWLNLQVRNLRIWKTTVSLLWISHLSVSQGECPRNCNTLYDLVHQRTEQTKLGWSVSWNSLLSQRSLKIPGCRCSHRHLTTVSSWTYQSTSPRCNSSVLWGKIIGISIGF